MKSDDPMVDLRPFPIFWERGTEFNTSKDFFKVGVPKSKGKE